MADFAFMENTKETKKRSLSKIGWYWSDKRIVSEYARRIRPSGLAVYVVLCYFANSKTQTCYPTKKAIADLLGISRKTVSRKIKLLTEIGLVKKEISKGRRIYTLLEPRGTNGTPGGDRRDTTGVTSGITNKNNITRIINNIVNEDKINSFTERSSKDFKPETREELLALDLAKDLHDLKSLGLYLHYAKTIPESLLRKTLSELRHLPDNQIKKSRAALFNYIIQKHAKENAPHHRD
jgi:DNA-binding transcriptional ArsR family regulator